MTDSLRDQLLGLGFKPPAKPERKPERKPHGGSKPAQKIAHTHTPVQRPVPGKQGKSRSREDIDLARAYAIRAQREKDERIEAERQKQEAARLRREARERLGQVLQGKALNDPAAEIARHFEYGGKIKRIHVNAAQLKALNAGELGVVQMDGRYLLVEAAMLAQAEDIFPQAVALKVDPAAPAADDPYADPQYAVPDDLVW